MALPKEKFYTIEDIYELPEGVRAELIDGKIHYMAAPSRNHQRISHFLDNTIGNYINSMGGLCEVYAAPFAVFLCNDDKNYVEPDISVICDPGKLDNKGCNGAPDWIIEIVSDGSRHMDYLVKLLKYRSAGVKEYWIVDPLDNSIITYDFDNDKVHKYTFASKIKVSIYKDFEIDFSLTL